MKAERWQQIEELFHAAREQPVHERAVFLERNCAGDEELRLEVESLLAKDAEADGPVDRPAWDTAGSVLEGSPEVSLPEGASLGPYRITGEIGAGGMGRVYRANDSRLGRPVAIKFLRDRFSERFEREARAIAALNHPNICTLYDVGPNYLVMELVEGPTVADRIKKGPIPLQQVLEIARQIADALEAAHNRGIVHRDLKPGNIKIKPDGTVKMLDFGLAKMENRSFAGADGAPAVHTAATGAGMVLGTAAYMAPEQARGETVDKRADIWSFGTILYEMLTGKRLFTGNSPTEVLAGVLKEEPDLTKIPLKFRRLIQACLEKDHKNRLRDIGDALRLLSDDDAGRPVTRRRPRWLWPIAVVALILALGALVFSLRGKTDNTASRMSFQITPPGITRYSALVLSPNGERLAFSGTDFDGVRRLWVRDLDSLTARSIPEAEGIAGIPIWSPDGRYLAFASGGQLKKVDLTGGPPVTLCDWTGEAGFLTGEWSSTNVIVFSRPRGGLQKVLSVGGSCSDITSSGTSPSFLPDGHHFIYFRDATEATTPGVYAGSLDAKPAEQPSQPVVANPSRAAFVASTDKSRGYLVFNQLKGLSQTLVAQVFDVQRMSVLGEPRPIPLYVAGGVLFSFSSNGTMAYSSNGTGRYQNVWYDRTGKVVGTAGDAGDIGDVALSPDDTLAAYHNREGMDDLWLFDVARRISTRFTTGPYRDHQAVWSPDGRLIVWGVQQPTGQQSLYIKASNSTGEERLLEAGEPGSYNVPSDWSPDGRFFLYGAGPLASGPQFVNGICLRLWVLPLHPDGTPAGQPATYLQNPTGLGHARFSPDGRWVAYTLGTEENAQNIYVSPFPLAEGHEDRWAVSSSGGYQPLWGRDGKELFYLSPDSKVMAVEVETASSTFRSGTPKPLFTARIAGGPAGAPTHRWDISHDGTRFLMTTVLDVTQSPAINVVTNWDSSLKR